MKNVSFTFAGLFCLLLSIAAKAQTSSVDYFIGKWDVLIKGTSKGDMDIFIVLEKKESFLTGAVQDTTGKETSKIDQIEVKPYFTSKCSVAT